MSCIGQVDDAVCCPEEAATAAADAGLLTGDVRRALEMLRRAVEIARQQHLADLVANGKPGVAAAAAGGGGASSSRHHQQQQQQQALEVQWKEGDAALVLRGHVRQAQAEMFSALHLQLLRSRSCWEKVMLVSMVVEARATSKSAVVIQASWGPWCWAGRGACRIILAIRVAPSWTAWWQCQCTVRAA